MHNFELLRGCVYIKITNNFMIKLNIFYFCCFLLTRINKKNLRYLSVLDTSSIVVARCILELKGDILSGAISTGSLNSTRKVELVPSQVKLAVFCAQVVQESKCINWLKFFLINLNIKRFFVVVVLVSYLNVSFVFATAIYRSIESIA